MPTEQSTIMTHQQEGGEEIEEDIESDNLEYAMTKENLKEIEKEIVASRKKKTNQGKVKGKHQLIMSESEDEEELLAIVVNIIEDAVANKISVETQFKRFVDARAKQGRSKKVKTSNPVVDENIVDLVSTPPPPSQSAYPVRIRRRSRTVGYCCRHHRRCCSKQNISQDTV